MTYDFRSVPIPERMKHLTLDRRGYPITANIYVDREGKPHFAINVEETRQRHIVEGRCALCDGKLNRGRWYAGGPISAFTANGAFGDPAMHHECARYAMQVCPYLAMPSYTNSLNERTVAKDPHLGMIFDSTMFEDRPDPFVMVMAVGEEYRKNDVGFIMGIKPKRPYRNIEFWSEGRQLSQQEGAERAAAYIQSMQERYSKGELKAKLPSLRLKKGL